MAQDLSLLPGGWLGSSAESNLASNAANEVVVRKTTTGRILPSTLELKLATIVLAN
mgnify:CR=1 FL=1